jgi:hypothetical protein
VRVCSIPTPSFSWATLLFGCHRLHITDSDCGVCSWPWHWFAFGNTERSPFVTGTRCTPVKNTLDWSAVAFCACEITHFFSVVFWVVRAVLSIDFRFVMNETRKTMSWHDFDRIYVFPRPSSRVLRDSTHVVQVNCILWSERHYM